jgi:hypothetical protein
MTYDFITPFQQQKSIIWSNLVLFCQISFHAVDNIGVKIRTYLPKFQNDIGNWSKRNFELICFLIYGSQDR